MPELLLPPAVAKEIAKEKYAAERRRRAALINRLLDFDDPVCREWQPHLRQLDPGLRLGRARPQAYEPDMNVRPGFYHWVRDNGPGFPMTCEPITDLNDGWTEPDSSLLEQLKRNDLQDPRVARAHVARKLSDERARQKAKEDDRNRITETAIERFKSANNVSVSIPK